MFPNSIQLAACTNCMRDVINSRLAALKAPQEPKHDHGVILQLLGQPSNMHIVPHGFRSNDIEVKIEPGIRLYVELEKCAATRAYAKAHDKACTEYRRAQEAHCALKSAMQEMLTPAGMRKFRSFVTSQWAPSTRTEELGKDKVARLVSDYLESTRAIMCSR